MSESSSVDVEGEKSSSDPSQAIEALRQRSQRVALRLQEAQREMKMVYSINPNTSATSTTASATSTVKVCRYKKHIANHGLLTEAVPGPSLPPAPSTTSNNPATNRPNLPNAVSIPIGIPVTSNNQATNRHAIPNAGSIPIGVPMTMSLPYHLPMAPYAVTMQMTAQHQQMQILQNLQSQQALNNGPPSQPVVSQRRKSKRALRDEVEALKEMVQRLSQVSPDMNAYAGQLIRQSEVLSQLDWLYPSDRAKNTQMPQDGHRRVDGGSEMGRRQQVGIDSRQRRESELSSTSSSSAPVQNQVQAQPGQGQKKRNRKKRDGSSSTSGKDPQQTLKTELGAMRRYINKIVQYYIGLDHQLPKELRFTGGFEDLEEHARRLAAAGYGRVVEEEIRVNRKNNRQAFITMSTDREALERDGIVLLPVARRYAFEGDKVRAFVLNGGAQSSPKSGESSGGITGGKASISLADNEDLSDETESQDSEADGDNVIVISSDNCPKAFVIAITKQTELRQIVGTISFTNPTKLCDNQLFYKFRPYDLRVPMVFVPQNSCAAHIGNKQPSEVSGLLYLAHILETDCNGHCIAELIQPVGRVGNLEDELKAILFHNNLRDIKPFEQRFNDMYSQPVPPVSADDLRQRRDLRKKCIFTIDPLTARDLDDAVSVEQLGDNEFEVGVHISDVSYYLPEACELDDIVKERSTSIYLVNEVIHMLPQPMCMRCSLLPGEDKFAFSVFWRMNGEGAMLKEKPEFARTVINSCTQFAYEHAQKIIDNPRERFTEDDFPTIINGYEPNDIKERVLLLHSMASGLRKQRFENGSLTINNAKLRFVLDPISGEPQAFEVEKQQEANRMIEEFMLLANQAVARFVHDSFPEIAVLRNHPPPLTKSLKSLKEKLLALGFELDYSSSKALQESMVRLCKEAPNPVAMNACLSQLLMKPMARATYFCSEGRTDPADLWHYALSIPIYTHFTSPIRRYPDIMVHRLLAAALNYCLPPARSTDELHALTKLANERKLNAKLAGDDSGNLYFKRYVRNKQGVYMTAVVMEIFQHMMNVVTLESGHVISIHYKMQKVLVQTQNAPNYILIAERCLQHSPRKLQLLSIVPIWLVIWENKLAGFFTLGEQRPAQLPKEQSGGSDGNRTNKPTKQLQQHQHNQQQQQQNYNNQQHHNQQQQQHRHQQQRIFAMRQNSL